MLAIITFLIEIVEYVLQSLACKEDAALYRSQREVHALGNLVVLVALDVHNEGDAVLVGDIVDGARNFVYAVGAFGSLDARFLAEVEVVEVFGGVDNGGGTAGAAIVVDEDVAHDCEYPAFEVGVFGVLVFIVESFQGCILEQVVSVVAVLSKHVGEVKQVSLQIHKIGLKFSVSHSCKFYIVVDFFSL